MSPEPRRVLSLKARQKPAVEPQEDAPPPVTLTMEGEHSYPSFWSRGQLLNVKNAGSHYNVTVLGEEYDPRHPERCLQFQNSYEANRFVGFWYASQGSGR